MIDVNRCATRITLETADFHGVRTSGPVHTVCADATFEQNLEPEYIGTGKRARRSSRCRRRTPSACSTSTARFDLVRSLGFKDHGLKANALDPSDRDGGIHIEPWKNLFGVYLPDAIASYTRRGDSYFVTANEGDARERTGCEEESRVKDLRLDPAAFPNGEGADAKLGRLNVTTTLGATDGDGDYDRLYAFGGRSMSILDEDGKLVYDTGSELERIAAQFDPLQFNMDNVDPSKVDDRSDNKGPEPEGRGDRRGSAGPPTRSSSRSVQAHRGVRPEREAESGALRLT